MTLRDINDTVNIIHLTESVLTNVFSFLGPQWVSRCQLVCTGWYDTGTEEELWTLPLRTVAFDPNPIPANEDRQISLCPPTGPNVFRALTLLPPRTVGSYRMILDKAVLVEEENDDQGGLRLRLDRLLSYIMSPEGKPSHVILKEMHVLFRL